MARVVSFARTEEEVRGQLAELRALLREKGLSENAEKTAGERIIWKSGVTAIDGPPGGGFPAGGISEVVAGASSSGSGLLVESLFRSARRERRCVGLVDGRDSFDPASVDGGVLPYLFWVRCVKAAQAMRAIDLLARDGNLSLLLLDLRENSLAELRRQPPGTWHRLQRVAEKSGACLVALTPATMVTSARLRFVFRRPLTLRAFEQTREELLAGLDIEEIRRRSVSPGLLGVG